MSLKILITPCFFHKCASRNICRFGQSNTQQSSARRGLEILAESAKSCLLLRPVPQADVGAVTASLGPLSDHVTTRQLSRKWVPADYIVAAPVGLRRLNYIGWRTPAVPVILESGTNLQSECKSNSGSNIGQPFAADVRWPNRAKISADDRESDEDRGALLGCRSGLQ